MELDSIHLFYLLGLNRNDSDREESRASISTPCLVSCLSSIPSDLHRIEAVLRASSLCLIPC